MMTNAQRMYANGRQPVVISYSSAEIRVREVYGKRVMITSFYMEGLADVVEDNHHTKTTSYTDMTDTHDDDHHEDPTWEVSKLALVNEGEYIAQTGAGTERGDTVNVESQPNHIKCWFYVSARGGNPDVHIYRFDGADYVEEDTVSVDSPGWYFIESIEIDSKAFALEVECGSDDAIIINETRWMTTGIVLS